LSHFDPFLPYALPETGRSNAQKPTLTVGYSRFQKPQQAGVCAERRLCGNASHERTLACLASVSRVRVPVVVTTLTCCRFVMVLSH
jgi:hypothetical protein